MRSENLNKRVGNGSLRARKVHPLTVYTFQLYSFIGLVTISETYKRELWYRAMNTIAPVAKNGCDITRFKSNNTIHFFKKYFKIFYYNLIELNKGYKSINLFPNLVSIKKLYINLKLRTF